MGDSKGPLRLKGLFVFGAVTLSLGYAVPIASAAAAPQATLGAGSGQSRFANSEVVGSKPRSNPHSVYVGYSRTLTQVVLPVNFATRELADPALPLGTRAVAQAGIPGSRLQSFAISFEDDVAVDRQLLSERVTPAVDEVIKVGAKPPLPAARPTPVPPVSTPAAPADPSLAGARAIAGSATSYCLTGTTATGSQAGPGSIAVDPSVIPLGSHLFVPGYGTGWAVDTGSAIKGTLVDVWLPCDAATRWGRRAVTIYVLAS